MYYITIKPKSGATCAQAHKWRLIGQAINDPTAQQVVLGHGKK